MRKLAIVVGLAVALVAVACGDSGGDGGDGLSESEQKLADVIRAEILAENEPDSPFGETEADCVATRAVRDLGVDGLLELGFTEEGDSPDSVLEQATPEQREVLVDITLECVDFKQLFVDQFAADGSISEESAECLGDELSGAEILRAIVERSLAGDDFDAVLNEDPDLATSFLDMILECLSPEELVELGQS